MRNNDTAEVRHVNYQSDFRVVFSFPNNELPQYPWRLELFTPNTPGYNVFVAWFDGENYHNCKPQEDGTLLVPVDNHDLAPGVLTYKINIDDEDADFPDGFMNVTIPGTLAVELWTGPSDEFAGEIGVVVLPVKGDPGPGVPAGGKAGQTLAKRSDEDFDTEWVDPQGGSEVTVVQTTGQSTTDVMSQKAVTDELGKKVNAEDGKGLSSNDYTNEEKTKVANSVLTSPQTLTPQQQEQARKNINSAPGYYNQNGFVISPLGMSAIGLRYVGYKEDDTPMCYLLTLTRCLKFNLETFEVLWDVKIEGSSDNSANGCEYIRVIGDIVYVIMAKFGGVFGLTQISDIDGSTISVISTDIHMDYAYDSSFKNAGCPLITYDTIYALDFNNNELVSFDIETQKKSTLRSIGSWISKYMQVLWIKNENNVSELVALFMFDNIIYIQREDGSHIEINIEDLSLSLSSNTCFYVINLSELNATFSSSASVFKLRLTKNSATAYTASISSKTSIKLITRDRIVNSKSYVAIDNSLQISGLTGNPWQPWWYKLPYQGAIFADPRTAGTGLVCDCISDSQMLFSNIVRQKL